MTIKQLLTESFTTKDGYLAWRAAWRSVYKQLSEDLRLYKMLHKDDCRNPYILSTAARERQWTEDEIKRVEARPAAANRLLDGYRATLKCGATQATLLLGRREWSKKEAQRQYQAEHACSYNVDSTKT